MKDTDRELLEAAAKAAGYTLEEHFDANGLYWPWCLELEDNWCPLTSDADALRLAVKLGLDVLQNPFGQTAFCVVVGEDSQECEVTVNYNSDPYAATRRAIVRAAAEIGRSMK